MLIFIHMHNKIRLNDNKIARLNISPQRIPLLRAMVFLIQAHIGKAVSHQFVSIVWLCANFLAAKRIFRVAFVRIEVIIWERVMYTIHVLYNNFRHYILLSQAVQICSPS